VGGLSNEPGDPAKTDHTAHYFYCAVVAQLKQATDAKTQYQAWCRAYKCQDTLRQLLFSEQQLLLL